MPRIYLVRHAEAAAAWTDDPDPGLSVRGRDQAAQVAEALVSLGTRPVLTSPMRRARETADALASRWGVHSEVTSAVGEVPTPDGVALEERGVWLRDFMNAAWAEAPPEVTEWRVGVLDALRSLHGDAVVFTHFMAINAVVGAAEGAADVVVLRPGNASVTVVDVDGPSLEVVERGAQANTLVL